jgi:hypothetical protein
MAMILISIASLCLAGYLGYRVWFLAGALADQQDATEELSDYIQALESTNAYMYDRIEKSYNAMVEIDRLGAFEKDDESGTTFQLLNEVITQLKSEFEDGTQENQ